ncbi:MAG: hypothetical protein ACRD4Q_01725 [Candidatus Acidiferrales bacterium]
MGVFAQPVPANVLTYTPGVHSFAALAANMLGDTGDSSDGFDAAFQLTLAAVPAGDQNQAASDGAFDDLASAVAGFTDSGLDDLAAELASIVSNAGAELDAFNTALGAVSNPISLPATPSDISLPDYNVSNGIPAIPSAPNPPVSGPPAHTPAPPVASPPLPIYGSGGIPFPAGTCFQPSGPCANQGGAELCGDTFGLPIPCGYQKCNDPFAIPGVECGTDL